jgi:glycosyltransferase involved in cell wall biosynthesis
MFYCDNCLRDVTLVRALRKQGHDVVMVPLYLPVRLDPADSAAGTPIFFGGINVYLQQKWGLFRKTPRWIDRLFDSPGLLRWVCRRATMTGAKDLGETTLSMLRGAHGRQAKELDRLVKWLACQDNKPDVVWLSNALLMGLVKRIRTALGAPVLCLLQDEDGFLDALPEPYSEQTWNLLVELSNDVDAFIAVSKYYADVMRQRLELSEDRLHVLYTGIPLDGYELPEKEPEVPTIGYLSRMCSNKGLDTLVEAFIRLKRNEKLENARLRIAGGRTRGDEAFINRIRQQLRACGLIDDVEFLPSFDRESKLAFLRTLSVLSVPEKQPVAHALYVLEALAAGVPVVEPASGAFAELLEMTGGGVLCEPNNAAALAEAMEPLLFDPKRARELGKQGREAVLAKFDVDQTAEAMVRICEDLAERSG